MAEISDTKQAEAIAVDLVAPLELPSLTSVAESILVGALQYCAQKVGASSLTTVIGLLERQDSAACEYCLYGVARLVAASMGAMDDNVKKVYLLDYDATPEDRCFETEAPGTRLIHLLVWTHRKTAALDSLVEALDDALVQAISDTLGVRRPATLLDVHLLDDAEVEQRRGYGAFRGWVHQKPVQIWER